MAYQLLSIVFKLFLLNYTLNHDIALFGSVMFVVAVICNLLEHESVSWCQGYNDSIVGKCIVRKVLYV